MIKGLKKNRRIKVTKDGPYVVSEGVPLVRETVILGKDGEPAKWDKGPPYPDRDTYALCRCGRPPQSFRCRALDRWIHSPAFLPRKCPNLSTFSRDSETPEDAIILKSIDYKSPKEHGERNPDGSSARRSSSTALSGSWGCCAASRNTSGRRPPQSMPLPDVGGQRDRAS